MVAGIVAGKIRGLALAECARLATAFSMTAISHIGSGLPSIEAVAVGEANGSPSESIQGLVSTFMKGVTLWQKS